MVCMNWFSIILKSKQHARFNKFKCLRYDSTRVVTISTPQGARMYDYVSRQRGSLALLSAVVIYSDTPLMLLSTWERDDQESGWKRWEVRVRIVFSKNRKFFSLDSQYSSPNKIFLPLRLSQIAVNSSTTTILYFRSHDYLDHTTHIKFEASCLIRNLKKHQVWGSFFPNGSPLQDLFDWVDSEEER